MKYLFILFVSIMVISCGGDSAQESSVEVPGWAESNQKDSVFIQLKNGDAVRVSRPDYDGFTWDENQKRLKKILEIQKQLDVINSRLGIVPPQSNINASK
jgi:hypothetical protein